MAGDSTGNVLAQCARQSGVDATLCGHPAMSWLAGVMGVRATQERSVACRSTSVCVIATARQAATGTAQRAKIPERGRPFPAFEFVHLNAKRTFRRLTLRSATGTAQRAIPTLPKTRVLAGGTGFGQNRRRAITAVAAR